MLDNTITDHMLAWTFYVGLPDIRGSRITVLPLLVSSKQILKFLAKPYVVRFLTPVRDLF